MLNVIFILILQIFFYLPDQCFKYNLNNLIYLAGINIENSGSTDVAMLHEDLIDVMPAVEEANSISEELDKRVKFEIILIAPNMLGKLKHKHEGFEDRDKTSSQPEVCC